MEEQLYSVRQVAILLKVHHLTVRRYIKEGKLRAIKAGGNVRIPQSALDQLSQDIHPTDFGTKNYTKIERTNFFTLDDPIFRLKGRAVSLKPMDF